MSKKQSEKAEGGEFHSIYYGRYGKSRKGFAVEGVSRSWDVFLSDISSVKLLRLDGGVKRLHHLKVLFVPCNLADSDAKKVFRQRIDK